ncbi:hypothetical protein [Streptomyces endophytica]|uniref:Uncharacterized protein n=1 Tax=Streptomyces endophytica TaxID=2991496 RepID=A0ABY6P693_9ACTN|nr:hypothetical protein [Streptomyces endophytica]UZJ29296.1 hypothetical protein OJ254_00780 [Streptomyces endophytica]
MHPALAEEIRAGLPDVRDAQTRIAMALLEAVPQQDWAQADPYLRDHLAAHTLEAGLLPQLLTDPGLFAHADPVVLRAAIEAVPLEALGAPARTYLRTAPLLTRSQAPAEMRAAFLETAFVEDGLTPYAEALHTRGFRLPWRTLWSAPLPGVRAVTTGTLPQEGAGPRPVVALVVPEDTPGSRTVSSPTDGTGPEPDTTEGADGAGAPDVAPGPAARRSSCTTFGPRSSSTPTPRRCCAPRRTSGPRRPSGSAGAPTTCGSGPGRPRRWWPRWCPTPRSPAPTSPRTVCSSSPPSAA